MKAQLRLSLFVFLALFLSPALLPAQSNDNAWSVAMLDQLLSNLPRGATTAAVGDMEIPVTTLQDRRNQLAGGPQPQFAVGTNITLWPSGNVYYVFTNTLTADKQRAFTNAAMEWGLFANVHFIPRTVQANYMFIMEDPALQGGQSAVGMQSPAQLFHIGPNAWSRGVLVHEIGHTLGLVHEHQRSDRDSFITILSNNISPGQQLNFTLLTTSQNHGAYDFLSVMHYAHNAFSSNPNTLDTMVPLPAYSQFYSLMGHGNPVLSALDRAGMAFTYGAATVPVTNVVTNTQDTGPGSLRAAIYYAFDHPGTTITFNIATNDPGYTNGVFTIQPVDELPGLANGTVIDGSTEPVQLNPNGPAIQINGALPITPSTFCCGIRFIGTNSAVRSLVINGFADSSIRMDGTNVVSNTVSGCYLGVDPSGSSAVTNGFYPVYLLNGANGNTIGGTNAAARNVISGSALQGVLISDSGTTKNTIAGNYVGLDRTGTLPLPNGTAGTMFSGYAGVGIFGGARSNIIGGMVPGARNVISGNQAQGVVISGTGSTGNIIEGNYLGLNAAGTAAVSNGWAGAQIGSGAQGNIVGPSNVISGNDNQGVLIADPGTTGNVVAGNWIGLNAAGNAAIPNGTTPTPYAGVDIAQGAQSNLVGGTTAGSLNVISGNSGQGVLLEDSGTAYNIVAGNYLGLNPAGTAAIPNGWSGAEMYNGASGNTIGGTVSAARNVISGNGNDGVLLDYPGVSNNVVEGNYLGLNAAGSAAVGNTWAGVEIYNAPNGNLIGGTTPGARNVISGNGIQGVDISYPGSDSNVVQGNYIGLNAAGTGAVPNHASGVEIRNGPQGNLIGGGIGARNFISGNLNYGILIDNGNSAANLVKGNTVGLDGANSNAVPNAFGGVHLDIAVQNNQVGGVNFGDANLIASNLSFGVVVNDSAAMNNSIRGNSIYGNGTIGIGLFNSANNSQAAPALSTATVGVTNTTINGSLTSLPGTLFQLDFYASPAPSSSAQARDYLGATNVTTGGGGSVVFTFTNAPPVPVGQIIRATATDPWGNTSGLSGPVTNTAPDSVGDGIPNAWRAAYFGGPGTLTNSINCATCDPDHDGANNLAEFLSGTNPTNAASALRLANPVVSGLDIMVGIPTVKGVPYRIEYKDDLKSGSWTIMADQVLGPGGNLFIIDPGAALLPKRFYQVQVFP